MAELDDGTLQATLNANYKAVAEQPAQFANMMMGNAVANQQAAQGIITKSLGNTLSAMDRIGMSEAVAIGGLQSRDLASVMMSLISSIGGGQVATKAAQSTPPETAT